MNDTPPTHAKPQSAFIAACGAKLNVVRQGTGEPVVCLHATGHSSGDFARLAQRLGHRFEFIAIDWPGQGESPREQAHASAARYAELLAGAAEALHLERFTILGNSIGGAAAIAFAAGHPERVRALVLCNPGGLQPVGPIAPLLCGYMAKFVGGGERGEKSFPKKFRRYYEKTVLPMQAAAWRREEIIATANAVSPILRQAWQSFGEKRADIRHLTEKLRCPVLYAWAKRDAYVAWSRCRRAALRTPNHRVVLFDAGHAAFLEQPEAFEAAFVSFMDDLPRALEGEPHLRASIAAAVP